MASRSLGWFAVGASLFASNISSEHLIGLAADGFRTGLAVGNYEWGACIILIVLGAIFVPFYVGAKIKTMPEFLARRYGEGAKFYLSIVTIAANILVRISVALYAGGLVMEKMFGLNMWVAIIILSVITVIYTALGGLKAVVYTDAVQAVILLVGTSLLSYIALTKVGGWDTLKSHLDSDMFKMIKPASDPEMPWTGLLMGVPVLGLWYWCTDQVIVQRVLGAKSIHQARMGTLFAAFLKILPVFLFVLPGVCGKVLFPEVEAKTIFPHMVEVLLPVGIKGLVSAALIAALMSSIDSTLNSTGTLISLDFYKKWRPEASPHQAVRVGQWTTVLVMIFGILWVLVVMKAESLFQYLQAVNAAISPPIAVSFLIGVFWPRANHQGALSALIGGLIIGILFMIYEPFPFLVSAGVNFILSLGILVGVSLLTPAPQVESIRSLTWSGVKDHISESTTAKELWLYRLLAGVLIIFMIFLWSQF